MALVLPEIREPSTSERFGQAFSNVGQAAAQAIPLYLQQKEQRQQLQKENESIKNLGLDIDVTNINDPKIRQEAVAAGLKGKFERQKSLSDQFMDEKSYGQIKDVFGQKFADIWKAAPVGGKTELLKHGIDAKLRGDNLEEMLQGVEIPQSGGEQQQEAKVPQLKNGKVSEEFEWPDYSKRPPGYIPKEWKDEMKTWRKENSPIYLENKSRLQANKKDELGIKNLKKLNASKKLPEGFERLIINPETGDIRGTAQLAELASPEAQEWVKEVARFQNRAKEAFGARVTNFDLVSYMKQFPGLLNTGEGRERILEMMEINNKLDSLYDTALQKIYQKYGLNGIPHEEADKLAQNMVQDETTKLYDKYLSIDEKNQNEEPKQLSGKMIDVQGPDGQQYEVDESELDQLPEGYRII